MGIAAEILKTGLLAWLLLLGGVVLLRMLTGEINLAGLFRNRGEGGPANPARVQSMFVLLAVIAAYALQAVAAGPVAGAAGQPSLPDVPESLLAVLAGSNGVYLAGKIFKT